MQVLTCQKCGTRFNCGSTKTHSCWCMNLPNMTGNFDLAGDCLCPDCMTQGKAKAITHQRRSLKSKRRQDRTILRNPAS